MTHVAIRPERPGDEAAIHALTAAAFAPMPYSDGSEPLIIDRLRGAGALTLSLVAEEGGKIVGHIAFSPVTIADGSAGWYGLGPISVSPDRQARGIGGALVEAGLGRLREIGATGCVLLGDPGYYGRFGFAHDPALAFPGPPPGFFQALRLGGAQAMGNVSYHPAFGG